MGPESEAKKSEIHASSTKASLQEEIEDAAEIWHTYDINGDGNISEFEFHELMKVRVFYCFHFPCWLCSG